MVGGSDSMLKTDQRCVGIVTTDPLRQLGLQEIFTAHGFETVISLSGPGALKSHQFPLIAIDAACTEHLFELLATFRTTRPKLKLIVIGLSEDFAFIERVVGAGAKGYLTHSARESEIHMAIDIVLDGSIWAPRKVLARLLDRSAATAEAAAAEPNFTQREMEVLRLLVGGQSNREIAASLHVDEGTVKAHVGRLLRKVGVGNRTALSVQALNRNLFKIK